MISNCTIMYFVGTCTKTVTLSCFCLTCCQKSAMFVVQSFKFNTNQWIVLYSWNFRFKIYENAGGQDLDRWDGVGWADDRIVARAAAVATFRGYGTTTISRQIVVRCHAGGLGEPVITGPPNPPSWFIRRVPFGGLGAPVKPVPQATIMAHPK